MSRILDVLIAEKEAGRNEIIDPTGVGVTGCSRLGKGAFTIGAFDERIALGLYQALGVEKNIAYHGGRADDSHNHCSFYDEQAEPLRRAIRAHLTRTAEPDGRMEPQPAAPPLWRSGFSGTSRRFNEAFRHCSRGGTNPARITDPGEYLELKAIG